MKLKVFLTILIMNTKKHYQIELVLVFFKNKERDLAIIALILASGIRLSEAVNVDLRDLNLITMVVEVTRKGGKRDAVPYAPFAKTYFERYLEVRSQRYKTTAKDTAFFCDTL